MATSSTVTLPSEYLIRDTIVYGLFTSHCELQLPCIPRAPVRFYALALATDGSVVDDSFKFVVQNGASSVNIPPAPTQSLNWAATAGSLVGFRHVDR